MPTEEFLGPAVVPARFRLLGTTESGGGRKGVEAALDVAGAEGLSDVGMLGVVEALGM